MAGATLTLSAGSATNGADVPRGAGPVPADRGRQGAAFRRKNGEPFGRVNVVDRFIKLRKRLKVNGLTAYSYRHTWATELLKAGMDVGTLASLMGNSAAVIRQHDSHLLADRQGLREKLERFSSAAEGT